MGSILSSENVIDFLKEHKVCPPDFQPAVPVICKESKNFNLVVKAERRASRKDDSSSVNSSDLLTSLLVKQNRVDSQGKTSGNLITEWVVQELIDNFSSLAAIQPLISEVVLFDRANSTLVSVFYDEYISLDDFYETRQNYDPKIANLVGINLAQIHRATYQQQQQREFLGRYLRLDAAKRLPGFIRRLNSLSPSIFAEICPDGLTFYKLYQRFPSLNRAVIELYDRIQPSCLTHNDLTLDNFIVDTQIDLDSDSGSIKPEQLKIIDWEFINWGDPASDLGMLVSQYLGEWLNSLVADRNLDLDTTLSLATCPLEKITPSLKAFLQGYLTQFPEIINHRPDFLRQVVQFAGIGILNRLSYYVEYHYHFHNESLCKLQVAKNLLCYPEPGIETLFGNTEAELIARISTTA